MGVRALLSILCLCLLPCWVQCADLNRRPVLHTPQGSPGTGCYFVVLEEKTPEDKMQQLMASISKLADDSRIHSVVKKISKAFTVKLSPYAIEMVRRMPGVAYIEEEGYAVGDEVKTYWHLDRLDQVLPTLDNAFWPIGTGKGVDVYILDSGIEYDHEDFEYRAKYSGFDPIDTDEAEFAEPGEELHPRYGRDCHGHGTHVASLCGGRRYGVAKEVQLYSVRVLACNNAGPWSAVLAGIEHVVSRAEATNRPSVISMSLGGYHYFLVNQAVRNAINSGVHVVSAAGNGGADSCTRSPASAPEGITVAGTRQGDGLYLLGPGTNFGSCISIFAPGERIMGADHTCHNCSKILSGTSMATPLVSGLVAIMLSRDPGLKPATLKAQLLEESLKDVINFSGMPAHYKSVTPNRLANVKGSCGQRDSPYGHATIASPSFPDDYPSDLDCQWEIGGEAGIVVTISVHYVQLELHHDTLRLYDGHCENSSTLNQTFTGDMGSINHTFTSSSNLLCLRLVTDRTENAAGFNATFTKTYAGTDLQVPNPVTTPIPTSNVHMETAISVSPRQTRTQVKALMETGYKLTWISSYRMGPDMILYFDYVATNSSVVDTVSFVEIRYPELNQTIQNMTAQGYSVSLLIDRVRGRGKNISPSYSVIFEPKNPIFETEVYLRDSYDAYIARLAEKTQEGFRLLSQSFCMLSGVIETTSVYVRDKRLAHGIPTPEYPAFDVRSNMTFFEFTTVTLNKAEKGYYPFAVEVFNQGTTTDSFFSVIYEERSERSEGNWFRWSLNTTATRDMIAEQTQKIWDVYLVVGYTYLGNSEHFLQFTRKP